jgi:hypothetical protein
MMGADVETAGSEPALSAAEPVMFVSEKQLPQCVGHYVPSRKTAEGNFQLALYRAPPAPSVAVKALEWSGPTPESNGCHVAKTIFGTYSAVNEDGWYVTLDDHPWGQGFEWSAPDMRMTFDDAAKAAQSDYEARIRSALSAQVQDVAGWQPISALEPKDGMIVMGWGEYRERDGFSPAFMRWYDSVGGWNVNAMPFYPTHWVPLPAAPAKQEG